MDKYALIPLLSAGLSPRDILGFTGFDLADWKSAFDAFQTDFFRRMLRIIYIGTAHNSKGNHYAKLDEDMKRERAIALNLHATVTPIEIEKSRRKMREGVGKRTRHNTPS